jgi:hypothetical protein
MTVSESNQRPRETVPPRVTHSAKNVGKSTFREVHVEFKKAEF